MPQMPDFKKKEKIKMTKSDLIQTISGETGIPMSAVRKTLNEAMDIVSESISRGEAVILPGFGTFTLRHRSARTSRNPRTGELIDLPACDIPVFKAGKRLKKAVNAG